MSETLFIADVHLNHQRPAIMHLFLQFLATRAKQAEALYILGDLFEVWIGDDDDEPLSQNILTALRHLTDQGTYLYVMPGNRDFLLGQTFEKATGCTLIADPTVLEIYGIPTLLMHGDSLCTLDVAYQTFRSQVRAPLWQQQFLAQPLTQRRQLAQQARSHSNAHTHQSAAKIMDVTPSEVLKAMTHAGVSQLIHGHTHRPAVHSLTLAGKPAYRKVVGDWREQGTVIISCTMGGCQLINYGRF